MHTGPMMKLRPKETTKFLYILDQETVNLGGLDRIKETVWELSLVRNSKWNLDWDSRIVKSYKVCFYSFLCFKLPMLGDKDAVFRLIHEGYLSYERFISCFLVAEESLNVLALAISQVASIHNNQYAIVRIWGQPASGPYSFILLIFVIQMSVYWLRHCTVEKTSPACLPCSLAFHSHTNYLIIQRSFRPVPQT